MMYGVTIVTVMIPPHMQYASDIYKRLFNTDHNIQAYNAGYYALDSLRVEKAYRHWGGELDADTTPWEAGLGFTVDMKKVSDIVITIQAVLMSCIED